MDSILASRFKIFNLSNRSLEIYLGDIFFQKSVKKSLLYRWFYSGTTFYSPQSFEANLKTALFFFLSFSETFCENQIFWVFKGLKGFHMFPIGAWACLGVLGRAWACLGVLGRAWACLSFYVLYVWAPAFLVTFEAIFCSNNIWNFLLLLSLTVF